MKISQLMGLALACVTLPTLAQTVKDAYVQDARGMIVRNANFGDPRIGNLCWRTGYWTPAQAIAECDGDIAPARKPAAAPPPKPAAAPPVAPPPKPTPVAPVRKCDFVTTMGTDEAFDFNKAVLKPAARTRLDAEVVAKSGNCSKVDVVVVTGHTDRIGSQQYNQKLSEKRAEAVAAYLQTKGLAGAEKLGAGKSNPVKSCDDKLPRPKLIECLAPNRRVTVEVRGPAK
jgi:OmpA-OmpF porin, OOP family